MIIVEDLKSEPRPLPHATSVGSGSSVQQLHAQPPVPIINEPREYAELPPAYESIVNLDEVGGTGSVPTSPRSAHSRSVSPHPRAQTAPADSTDTTDGRRYPSSSSLHPHYYSSDSYGGAPTRRKATDSPTRNFFAYLGEKLIPPTDLRNPPTLLPTSFTRALPLNMSCDIFPPMYLVDLGDLIFPVKPPPSLVQPHPFITHDVNEVDWKRFLGDIRRTAAIPRRCEGRAGLLLAVDVIGEIITATKGNTPRPKTVSTLVDLWNEYFFHPRRLEVVLAKGRRRVDNGSGPVPDLDPTIEHATPPQLTRITSATSLQSGTETSLMLTTREYRPSRSAAVKMLEPPDGSLYGKGKARWDADSRYRLFVVGF